jgi:hypothetical protein
MHQQHVAFSEVRAIDQRVIGSAVGGKKGRAVGSRTGAPV